MLDTAPYYAKLVNKEQLSENEVLTLLQTIKNAQATAAYLASCHAATLECLPASASKSLRSRLVSICATAAKALAGDLSGIRHPGSVEAAIERCARAASAAPAK